MKFSLSAYHTFVLSVSILGKNILLWNIEHNEFPIGSPGISINVVINDRVLQLLGPMGDLFLLIHVPPGSLILPLWFVV